ncbi:hypothetical protein D3C85_1402860 [compost metagenome]
MTRLRLVCCRTEIGTRGKGTHDDTVTIAIEVGHSMKRTVNTHTNTNVRTLIFNMNVAGVQAIGLINKILEHPVTPHGVQRLAHLGDRFTVALFCDLNIIVDHFFRRVKSIHKSTKRALANEEKLNISPIVIVLLFRLTN